MRARARVGGGLPLELPMACAYSRTTSGRTGVGGALGNMRVGSGWPTVIELSHWPSAVSSFASVSADGYIGHRMSVALPPPLSYCMGRDGSARRTQSASASTVGP